MSNVAITTVPYSGVTKMRYYETRAIEKAGGEGVCIAPRCLRTCLLDEPSLPKGAR